MIYAHLHNSIGSIQFFRNNLREARVSYEYVLPIYKDKLGPEAEEYIGAVSNMANLLAAECLDDESRVLYAEVERVHLAQNFPPNLGLAFLHLGVGRLALNKRQFESAKGRFLKAKDVVKGKHGPEGLYMAE